MLTGNDITKTYGTQKEQTKALNHVSITIENGEFVAVMGPSGCGKSTLLFCLSGTDHITDGSITLNHKELSDMKEHELADLRRQKMGFVFQQPTMLGSLNLLDNIILPASERGGKARRDAVRRGQLLMRQTGIADLARRDITEVSGGQLQRAGICRALINSPDILFADEPTGALNSKAADQIMEMFAVINRKGTAIMLVTHDARVAARAGRILFMKDGEIASEMNLSNQLDGTIQDKTELVLQRMREMDL